MLPTEKGLGFRRNEMFLFFYYEQVLSDFGHLNFISYKLKIMILISYAKYCEGN